MTNLTSLELGLIVAAMFMPTAMRFADATILSNGPYKFESLDSAPGGIGLGNYNVILFADSSGGTANAGGSVNVDDWAIFTFINPYDGSFAPTDRLLFNFKISGLDDGPETLWISGKLTSCEFDPNGCGGTDGTTRNTAGDTTGNSTGNTAGSTNGNPEPIPLILLIVGLIGLARLRGKPVK